jgi:opacity protein-like surface antigen
MRRISYRISMFKRMIVAAAALAMFLMPVFAPDVRASDSRWYVGLNVPVMFIDDSNSVEKGTTINPRLGPIGYTANAVNEYKTGFRVSGVLGYEFGSGFRIDGEVFFARASLGKLIYKGQTASVQSLGLDVKVQRDQDIPVSGSANQLGGMVNVWYDFNAGSRWRPYIGGGLGVVSVDWGDVEYNRNAVAQGPANEIALLRARENLVAAGQLPPGAPLPPEVRAGILAMPGLPKGSVPELSDTDTVFAYQLGAGMGYEVTDAITVQVGYRMLKSKQLEFTGMNASGAMATATTDMQVHLFEIGVRYRF